ncbi:TPM domain-containing protein [Peribacillus sp. SCS-155]|uniref:TPM domain-containing protein n=1 Tax=Peribacillus sedimenti TaxID=3115297 RepID=UPI0039066326
MKNKKVISLFVFLYLISFYTTACAADGEIPEAQGDIYVQDFADVLSPQQEDELRRLGRSVEDRRTDQIVVLTVDTIGDSTIEEYANQAYRQYGLGTKENNNGALLVVAMDDRKIRIEVGYGLESVLPDGKVGRILDENAIPYLQSGQPDSAITSTYKRLANEVSGQNHEEGKKPAAAEEKNMPSWLVIVIIAGVLVLDFTFFGGTITYFILSIMSRRGGGGGFRGGGGGSSGGGGAGRGW